LPQLYFFQQQFSQYCRHLEKSKTASIDSYVNIYSYIYLYKDI
jgi:hypothetical protein